MTVRAAQASDLEWIARLLREAGTAAQWWPAPEETLVIEPHAFLAFRAVTDDEFEILNLAVDPAQRRGGMARALVEAAVARGGHWFLEVRESNGPARSLYQSCGFREMGRRRAYYRDPIEDAILCEFAT